jgi:ankyrin repeat protein
VNATNEFGDTALVDVAVLSGSDQTQAQAYDRIAAILLEHGANPNAKSVTRDNVLDIAVTSGNAWLVDRLLAAAADAEYETALGTTIVDAIPSEPERRGPILEVLARYGISPARS